MQQHLVRDAAGERALHGDLDARVLAAKLVEQRQQIKAGVLVGGELELSAVEFAQLRERARCLRSQVQELPRVFAENASGVCERAIAGRPFEEDLAEFRFELRDGLAHGRLGAVQAGGGAGEAALLGHGEKGFELKQVHRVPYYFGVRRYASI